mgnify:CR=1 FL=1
MKIKIDRSSLNDWLVYCGVFLYIVVSILTTTFFSKYIPGSFVHLISILSIFLISLHNIIVRKIDFSVFGAAFTLGIMSLLIYFSIGSFQNYIYSLIIIFLLNDCQYISWNSEHEYVHQKYYRYAKAFHLSPYSQ